MIARKGTSGGISAVHPGREADNQQRCASIAERRYRRCMVRWILRPHDRQELHQASATPTITVKAWIDSGRSHGDTRQ